MRKRIFALAVLIAVPMAAIAMASSDMANGPGPPTSLAIAAIDDTPADGQSAMAFIKVIDNEALARAPAEQNAENAKTSTAVRGSPAGGAAIAALDEGALVLASMIVHGQGAASAPLTRAGTRTQAAFLGHGLGAPGVQAAAGAFAPAHHRSITATATA
ncbi:MAG: hypothetical protein A3J48_04020 [Candidatus Doudnabacteria bacterium RIFCSPHIGHO2_02_FULL_46_11]|uniref:Uncharacterized protein n=1 Tax=Candidatus Doudnabacteria bacterium RIFCSPHIGHO2_02_FULL_46_11 TaxID=1817832 RepID=A0A1F5P872_9BACT|nr:MAG: hypothetical protein A3J48_04020 [Candidatus Doudnabacteria bacterium RIFCSPHIGHO2_02_FULL_46_11]